MTANMILQRLAMVFTDEEMARIKYIADKTGDRYMVVDIHGMTAAEGKRFLSNMIAIIRCDMRLVIIHGYNHGTSLMTMCRQQITSSKIKKISSVITNPGRTDIAIAHAW